MLIIFKLLSILVAIMLSFPQGLVADTLYLKENKEIKGIVIENYHDRIVFNTIDGEKTFKKSDIEDILYDRREQNLLKLGDFHYQKDNLIKAYTYYRKAYQINPDYKEAQDRYIHIRSVLMRRPEKQFKSDMDRKRALFQQSGKLYAPVIKEGIAKSKEELFKQLTGIVLFTEDEIPKILSLVSESAASKAGIKVYDEIFSVWGRLTAYYDLDDIVDMIIDSPSPEIMLQVKREVSIYPDSKKIESLSDLGVSIGIKESGLMVSGIDKAIMPSEIDLLKEDIISDVNDKSIIYMPLNEVKETIESSLTEGKLTLKIIRNLTLWRKDV